MKMLEKNFTSSGYKLLKHPDRLLEIKMGVWRPIHVEIAPEEFCNLHCSFCSVANRGVSKSMCWEDVKLVVDDFVGLGVEAISWTGGGEVCFYPRINDCIEYVDGLGVKQGLITNGTVMNEKVDFGCLRKLSWIRISLNSLDEVGIFSFKVPSSVFLGFSYVVSDSDLFDEEKIDLLESYLKIYDAGFLRIVPNCLDRGLINRLRKMVPPLLEGRDERIFFQSKSYEKPEVCYWGALKPFVNRNNVYFCSANPLIDRKFSDKHVMGSIYEIKKIWKNFKPRTTEGCGLCFFKEQNDLVNNVLSRGVHDEFI